MTLRPFFWGSVARQRACSRHPAHWWRAKTNFQPVWLTLRSLVAVLRYGKGNAAPYGISEDAPVIAMVAPLGPRPTGTGIKVDQIGISHFGIWVKGLDAICAELKSKGVTFAAPPHIGAKTAAGMFRTAFLQDPDGILIQLDELVPA